MKREADGRENSLTQTTVVDAMKRWSIRFKDRRPDPAEMTFLAKEYYADLMDERVTEDEFAGADREVCKRNRFFPLVADLLTVVEALRQTKVKRIDIEWKRNFPEVLSPDEARMLGVSQNEIDRAKREYLPDNSQLKRLISGIGGLR